MASILIIDDDPMVCKSLSRAVEDMGHDAATAGTLAEGEAACLAVQPDVVFLDVRLPDGNGIEVIPRLKSCANEPEVIIVTGFAGPDAAEMAVRSGAWDYLKKPVSRGEMSLPLMRALQYRAEKKVRPRGDMKRAGIIGRSPQIQACLEQIRRAAESDAAVLITGETGTGKELMARAIHENSGRSDADFVVVDCAALTETLVESVLFGHVRGAFTSADKPREGLVKRADGGTLFLDEVGELPMTIQKTFLRVLQEHRFRPVGADAEIVSDFRLIAATNRELEAMVERGEFRQDLLYRLRTVSVEMPPLRERLSDVKDMAISFTRRFCERYELEPKGFSPDFFEALAAYDWPGNVRELKNVIELTVLAAQDAQTIFPQHLPEKLRLRAMGLTVSEEDENGRAGEPAPNGAHRPEDDGLLEAGDVGDLPPLRVYRDDAVARAEATYLRRMAELTDDPRRALSVSGLSKSRFYELLRKYRISFRK